MINASEVPLPFFQALTARQLSSTKTHKIRTRAHYIRRALREGLVQPPFKTDSESNAQVKGTPSLHKC